MTPSGIVRPIVILSDSERCESGPLDPVPCVEDEVVDVSVAALVGVIFGAVALFRNVR
jgi:hypothetical protein